MDLRTGQIKWTNPNINSVTVGQFYDFESPNQHGTTGSYLWATSAGFGDFPIIGTGIVNVSAAAVNATRYPIAPGTDLGAIASITNSTVPFSSIRLDGNRSSDRQTTLQRNKRTRRHTRIRTTRRMVNLQPRRTKR